MDEQPSAISLTNLVKKFSTSAGAVASLDDVTFDVPLGKVLSQASERRF